MARKMFQMLIGMKEHPETHELLFPGDVFELEEELVNKPSQMGGWLQPETLDSQVNHPSEVRWVLVCARVVPDETPESRKLRDEPSKVIGVNISERDYLAGEDAGTKREAANYPAGSARRRQSSPASVRQRQAPPGAGELKVSEPKPKPARPRDAKGRLLPRAAAPPAQ